MKKNNILEFTGVSSEEEAINIVQVEPTIVASFPEHLLTEKVLFEAMSRDHRVYALIDNIFFTDNLVNRLVVDNPQRAFENLNLSLIKNEHLVNLLKVDGLAIRFIPQSMLTNEICNIAIEQDVNAHEYVPLELRDSTYINKLISQSPEHVSRIDIELRDPEILKKIVFEHPYVIEYMSMTDRSPEICEAIMNIDPKWLAYFPENVYENPKMLEKISNLPYFLKPDGVFDESITRRTLAEFLMKKSLDYYKHIPLCLKTNELAFAAIEHNADNILCTPTYLKRNGKLWEVALKQKPEMYKNIPLNQQSDSIRIFIAREKARNNIISSEEPLSKNTN